MGLLRRKQLAPDADALKRRIVELVDKQKPGTPFDLSDSRSEVDALLASFSEFQSEWRDFPSVFRVARLESAGGVTPLLDTVVLPPTKHENLDLVFDMLNHIRSQEGLKAAKMPLFLQPDEFSFAVHRARRREENGPPPPLGKRRRRKASKKLRRAVLERADWVCERCQAPRDLHLHPVKGDFYEFDPKGYVLLCRRCVIADEAQQHADADAFGWAHDDDYVPESADIRSQLALVFEKRSLRWVGFVFGQEFVLLEN